MDNLLQIEKEVENYLNQQTQKLYIEQEKDTVPTINGLTINMDDQELLFFLDGLSDVFYKLGLFNRKVSGAKVWSAFSGQGGTLQKLILDDLSEGIWESLARSQKIKKNILGFYFLQVRRNFLRQAQKFAKAKSLKSDNCIFCGARPILASIHSDEEGQRNLHCAECMSVWEYSRIKCPFCKETHHDYFSEYHLEEQEASAFIEHCNKCGEYIKTLNKIKDEDINPVIEDAKTIYLDFMIKDTLQKKE